MKKWGLFISHDAAESNKPARSRVCVYIVSAVFGSRHRTVIIVGFDTEYIILLLMRLIIGSLVCRNIILHV